LRVPPPSDKIGWEGTTARAWPPADPNAEDPSVNPSDCIFCRIASGEIPATVVYRDEHVVAFRDIDPQAPKHVLVIPLRHIPSLELAVEADRETLGRMLLGVSAAARAEGVAESGYRAVLNVGADGGQLVPHVHVHVLGGRGLGWPPG
jgi:histidine triad (HIT) family protein